MYDVKLFCCSEFWKATQRIRSDNVLDHPGGPPLKHKLSWLKGTGIRLQIFGPIFFSSSNILVWSQYIHLWWMDRRISRNNWGQSTPKFAELYLCAIFYLLCLKWWSLVNDFPRSGIIFFQRLIGNEMIIFCLLILVQNLNLFTFIVRLISETVFPSSGNNFLLTK